MTELHTLSETTIDYFELYKQKALEIKSLKNKARSMQQQYMSEMNELTERISSLEQESLGMRRIITQVLEDDIDSVEARLTNDKIDSTNMWQGYHSIGGHIDTDKTALSAHPHYIGVAPNQLSSIITGGFGPGNLSQRYDIYQNGTTVGKITP